MSRLYKMISGITHKIKLADGRNMPLFGLGTWKTSEEEAYAAVSCAINSGYRLFDTATVYENEVTVGKALRESGLKRDEYFVVTKLHPRNHGYEETKACLRDSIKKLGLDYVDLYLIHSPITGKNVESWKAIVEMKKEGLTKSIGVSNFGVEHLKGLLATGMEKPAVNQIEFHPWYQQVKAAEFCAENDIAVMGYCPLARGRQFEGNNLLQELSAKYKKTQAQIILRWALQKGVITIPKSSNPGRIEENGSLYDFTLEDGDMKLMAALDENLHISKASEDMDQAWTG